MAEANRILPSLDLLKGFEAAARHLNFTRAADELFLTQSAVSRQIQTLEDRLGVRLFVRKRRGLALTHEGDSLFRAVSSALGQVQEAVESLSQRPAGDRVTVTCTMGFSSLWLIPRLGDFHRLHPEVDVRISANDRILNLERERIDVSVRYCSARAAPKGAVWLFDEEVLPVCSPALLEHTGKPLRKAQDLAHYVLLHLDDRETHATWLTWNAWFDSFGIRSVKPAGSLGFNYFDQIVRAALAGHGVALGRLPLIAELLQDGSLIAPLDGRARTDMAYWLVRAGHAQGRAHIDRFCEWLLAAARAGPLSGSAEAGPRNRRPAARRR